MMSLTASRLGVCSSAGRNARCVAGVAPRRASRAIARAESKGPSPDSTVDDYVNEYCSLDAEGKRSKKKSLGEMEQEFLDAMRSFYYDGKASMSNEEFDNLKNELLWEGSSVVVLSGQEQRFLEASMAYAAGKPIMSDEEFNKLKQSLKKSNSVVTQGGPRCSIRSKTMYADAVVDYQKMLLLNLPAVVVVLGVLFTTDFLSGFSVSRIISTPGAPGFLFLWAFLLPGVYVISSSLTNLVLREGVILTSQCPNCGSSNNAYFGDIFTVEGAKGSTELECESCKSLLKWDNDNRLVSVQRVGPAEKKAPTKEAVNA